MVLFTSVCLKWLQTFTSTISKGQVSFFLKVIEGNLNDRGSWNSLCNGMNSGV